MELVVSILGISLFVGMFVLGIFLLILLILDYRHQRIVPKPEDIVFTIGIILIGLTPLAYFV